jgi:hypothetical protein
MTGILIPTLPTATHFMEAFCAHFIKGIQKEIGTEGRG